MIIFHQFFLPTCIIIPPHPTSPNHTRISSVRDPPPSPPEVGMALVRTKKRRGRERAEERKYPLQARSRGRALWRPAALMVMAGPFCRRGGLRGWSSSVGGAVYISIGGAVS